MAEISKTYHPELIEKKWYKYWLDEKLFHSEPDERTPYTIVIPPPNVTGILHMGHILNNTLQDILIRKARMQGKNACWIPGTDHASIATEAKVVKMLKDKGIEKKDLSREDFLKYAWEWKEKYGGIILEQLKRLGCSCDWERTHFTMDEAYAGEVIDAFIQLYKDGHIYRGVRMVNWDPEGKTAVSDEEVIHKEVTSKLYYVKYPIQGSDEFITIATTRPETILGDTAVCVHPEDQRYQHLIGKKAIIPFVDRAVPVIADTYIDKEFGTGCLKVTPAHDINDYELGIKHQLEIIDTIAEDGTMSEAAQFYVGQDRFAVRKQIALDLEEKGLLVKVEEIENSIGTSERTGAVIEPKLSTQWFIKMKALSGPAFEHVMNDDIQLHPAKFKNTYRHWMENIKDWCISRQLWWGHRIPAYYLPNGEWVVAKNWDDAYQAAIKIDPSIKKEDLKQDEDVLDTWASSWLWPISVFKGLNNDNREISYYYPTDDLVTAPEILFFWVARMIIAGYYFKGEKPFSNVYLTGIVRDKQRRKMSKSLGNSPDPIELMEKYSTDGVRIGMLFSSPAGNDLLFDEKLCEQGRNFSNKLWNAFRLIKSWQHQEVPQSEIGAFAVAWMENRLGQVIEEVNTAFEKYRISDALMSLYKFTWNEFCSWYLELIKPAQNESLDAITYQKTIIIFDQILRLLHPFMPFITEEIWQNLKDREKGTSICTSTYPEACVVNETIIHRANTSFEIITQIRNIRNQKNISPKVPLALSIKSNNGHEVYHEELLVKMAQLKEVKKVDEQPASTLPFIVSQQEFYVHLEGEINIELEKEKILKEIDYQKGFLNSVLKKLNNDKFVNNAPENVILVEKRKRDDAENKIKALEESLINLEKE